LQTYGDSIVATQQWFVGPGQQSDELIRGYDQEMEDRLFEEINWPMDGYRLFDIGVFIGDRDWFDGVWESNCLFVTRAQLSQVGSFDESFDMPGGGYANLEIYERLGSSPDVNVCSMIGEASFHQTHGGTTTNQPDHGERRSRVFGYSEHYADLRGRAFKGPGKPIHLVGRINNEAARRSKSRRLSSKTFLEAVAPGGVDGPPVEPVPVPDELVWAFTEAVWRNMAWRGTTWLGRPIDTPPTDLLAYQELIAEVRPDWVVETAAGPSARAVFLASVCDLVGHGQVVSVNPDPGDDAPEHPRLRVVRADPVDASTVATVQELVGQGSAVVILGSRAGRHDTFRAFEAYSPLVPVGSAVVVTDTIVNGHPVWPGFGPGPAEGVKQILTRHGDFVADPDLQKYALTFNPGGYLRRVRS
jgi:cephalosporin hydroxylase